MIKLLNSYVEIARRENLIVNDTIVSPGSFYPRSSVEENRMYEGLSLSTSPMDEDSPISSIPLFIGFGAGFLCYAAKTGRFMFVHFYIHL